MPQEPAAVRTQEKDRVQAVEPDKATGMDMVKATAMQGPAEDQVQAEGRIRILCRTTGTTHCVERANTDIVHVIRTMG